MMGTGTGMESYTQGFSVSVSIGGASDRAKAVIVMNGTTYEFHPADGRELDPYHDPQGDFVMRCVVCTHAGLAHFRVYYRPDEASNREEWVFELGNPWAQSIFNMGGYTATITRHDGSTETITVPAHYWHSRWRWQSAPRPVRRTAAQLAAANLIPAIDVTGLAMGKILTLSTYAPMSYCGIPADMGQTGGYPGLGVITGWQAQYLARGAPESSFRTHGEVSGSYQWHVRDPDTGAPLDIVDDYPNATLYSEKDGDPYIRKNNTNRPDQGHLPSLAYVPWLLTGDPYFLEAMQFSANHMQLMLTPKSRMMVMGRYLAWPMRAIFEICASCPDVVPSWMLPRDYWEYWLGVCAGHIDARAANNSDPFCYFFHTIQEAGQDSEKDPTPSGDHVWQQAFLGQVVSWIACLRPDWLDRAEWLIRSEIDRASATSGWCRSRCSPYHMRMQACSVLAAEVSATATTLRLKYKDVFCPGETVVLGNGAGNETMTLGETSDGGLTWEIARRGNTPCAHPVSREVFGRKFTNWQEATESNVLVYGWTGTDNNDQLPDSTSDLTYPSYHRCALAQGLHAGLEVPGLQDAYAWLDQEVRRLAAAPKNLPVGDNWAVMPAVNSHRRRHHRRSERTDLQWHLELRAIIEAIRGVE